MTLLTPKPKVILKAPTLKVIAEANKYKGCLIPMNQSNLFFAKDLEQKAIEYGIAKEEDILRKKQIEAELKFGFSYRRIEQPHISEQLLAQCYDIIANGFVLLNVEEPFIIDFSVEDYNYEETHKLLEEFLEITVRLSYFNQYSVDVLQDRMFNYYLLSESIYNRDFKKVFADVDDILNADPFIIHMITARFVEFKHYIPECIFRALARGESPVGRTWLNRYGILGNNVFDELDENKMNLIRWTEQYNAIKESYEPPDDATLANDSELDNWLFNQKIDKKGSRVSGGNGGLFFNNPSASRAYVEPSAMTFEGG